MKERINPSNISDNTEKTWFIGTDLLEDDEDDLILMSQGTGAMMDCDEAAMFSTSHLKEDPNHYTKAGYSPYFQTLMTEALKREYRWVVFDRDIETA